MLTSKRYPSKRKRFSKRKQSYHYKSANNDSLYMADNCYREIESLSKKTVLPRMTLPIDIHMNGAIEAKNKLRNNSLEFRNHISSVNNYNYQINNKDKKPNQLIHTKTQDQDTKYYLSLSDTSDSGHDNQRNSNKILSTGNHDLDQFIEGTSSLLVSSNFTHNLLNKIKHRLQLDHTIDRNCEKNRLVTPFTLQKTPIKIRMDCMPKINNSPVRNEHEQNEEEFLLYKQNQFLKKFKLNKLDMLHCVGQNNEIVVNHNSINNPGNNFHKFNVAHNNFLNNYELNNYDATMEPIETNQNQFNFNKYQTNPSKNFEPSNFEMLSNKPTGANKQFNINFNKYNEDNQKFNFNFNQSKVQNVDHDNDFIKKNTIIMSPVEEERPLFNLFAKTMEESPQIFHYNENQKDFVFAQPLNDKENSFMFDVPHQSNVTKMTGIPQSRKDTFSNFSHNSLKTKDLKQNKKQNKILQLENQLYRLSPIFNTSN